MRDNRFVAAHRGGPLSLEDHRLLMGWAHDCAVHLLPLLESAPDERLKHALDVAQAWKRGEALVGEARKAAVGAHAVAREAQNESAVAVAVARAVGHAVATAHMADHSLGSVWYGMKAVKAVGHSTDAERNWQIRALPAEVSELVLSALESGKSSESRV